MTLEIFKRLILLGLPMVFVVDLIIAITSEVTQVQVESLMHNPQGQGHLLWVYGSLSILIYLFLSLLSFSIALFFFKSEPINQLGKHLAHNYGPIFKEGLRSMGKVGMWSFLLIIPGIVRLIQLSLVPFVVTFDPAYSEGRVDALKVSTRIVNGRIVSVIGIVTLVYFGLTMLIEAFFSGLGSFSQTPFWAVGITALRSFVFLLTLWLLFRLYRQSLVPEGMKHDGSIF